MKHSLDSPPAKAKVFITCPSQEAKNVRELFHRLLLLFMKMEKERRKKATKTENNSKRAKKQKHCAEAFIKIMIIFFSFYSFDSCCCCWCCMLKRKLKPAVSSYLFTIHNARQKRIKKMKKKGEREFNEGKKTPNFHEPR